MTKLMVRLQNTIADREERGAAMAEYGLLLALVALAAIVVLAAFGDSITGVFQAADDNLNSNMGGTDAHHHHDELIPSPHSSQQN